MYVPKKVCTQDAIWNVIQNVNIFVYPIFLENGKTEWVAEYPSLPYLVGGGDSPEEAVKEAEENKKVYIEECEADKAQSDSIKALVKSITIVCHDSIQQYVINSKGEIKIQWFLQ